jgi:hypothetical protein
MKESSAPYKNMLTELTKTIGLNNYTFQQKIISPVIIIMYLTKGEYMITSSKKSPTAKFFRMIDRELKKHEEKIMKKNGTHSSKF